MQPKLQKEIQWLLEEKHHGRLTPPAKKDIARLQKGEHVDYVIGFVDFLGCKVGLSSKPFIPRPETEYWVKKAIQLMQGSLPCRSARERPSQKSKIHCLDLFAGSGCIGIAVLKHVPQAHVDFGEKNKRLLSQIRLNSKKNGINQKRYRVLYSDVFSGIKGRYDYIFANPPYIAESRKNRVQSSVLEYEPKEALFARGNGLFFIRKFLKEAKNYLNPKGGIYMEFDSFQKPAIGKLLKQYGYKGWRFCKDQYGKWRFLYVIRI